MPVTTREERRQQRKLERQEAERRAARASNMRRVALLAGIGVAIVIAAVAVLVLARNGGGTPVSGNLPGTHFDDPVTARGQLYKHIPDTQPITADSNGHYPPTFGD